MYRSTQSFLSDIYQKRGLIYELAKRDFQRQYQGSYLGFVWMFLQPLVLIFVLYLVFTLGLRAGDTMEVPFELYLITGMIGWLYFSENLSGSTSIIRNHQFLVKKVDFRLSVLPLVKMLSSLVPQLFLIIVAIGVAWYRGYAPTIYTLQVFYYLAAMVALLLGIGWLTSSTSIFVKDVSRLVAISVQFGFWLTPIFWNIAMIPERYHWVIKLNPVYYIVTGYRDSLIGQTAFWLEPAGTLYYWGITLLSLIIGIKVYSKLRPHFAEVI